VHTIFKILYKEMKMKPENLSECDGDCTECEGCENTDEEDLPFGCPNCFSTELIMGLVFLDKNLVHVVSCLKCGYMSNPAEEHWTLAS
jgi:hypothetical protein